MPTLQFTVYGQPRPAGSKTTGQRKNGTRYVRDSSGRNGAEWRARVSQAAGAHMGGHDLHTGPLSVVLHFRLPRPKAHYTTTDKKDILGRPQLKPSAPNWPTTRPDVGKLERAVLDALTGIVYRDDSQIVWLKVSKNYTHGQACCEIRVEAA